MKKTAATAGVQGDLCRHCQKAVKPTNPERSVIGRVLTQAIFHDDEEELNDALDL
jgi:regulator of RNase E activity RraA